MRIILVGLCSAYAIFLCGCSSTWQYVKAPDQRLKVADASKARIYLIRPDSGSKLASTRITDNGTLIGNTGPHSYLCWERKPGTMKVMSVSADETATQLNVEAGGVYYVVQRVDVGLVYGKSSLTIVPEETGIALVKSCKPAYVITAEASSKRVRTSMDAVRPAVAAGGALRSGGGSSGASWTSGAGSTMMTGLIGR